MRGGLKVVDAGFSARAIGEVDLNKSEPWELPWKAKLGEKGVVFLFSALPNEWDICRVFQKSSGGGKSTSRTSLRRANLLIPLNRTGNRSVRAFVPEQSVLRALLECSELNARQSTRAEREAISISQQTTPTNDVNTSSVMQDFEMGRRQLKNRQQAPLTSAGPLDVDLLWNYSS
ncbi:hypothetical protein ACJRO7_009705 [Eucalyptus globulus]|uniref:Uncharacterized protein n=1 Tax=Eucalyptus globulus TaxID=34317 RepID=A0ABD3LF85_EUCGL